MKHARMRQILSSWSKFDFTKSFISLQDCMHHIFNKTVFRITSFFYLFNLMLADWHLSQTGRSALSGPDTQHLSCPLYSPITVWGSLKFLVCLLERWPKYRLCNSSSCNSPFSRVWQNWGNVNTMTAKQRNYIKIN